MLDGFNTTELISISVLSTTYPHAFSRNRFQSLLFSSEPLCCQDLGYMFWLFVFLFPQILFYFILGGLQGQEADIKGQGDKYYQGA